MDKISVKKIPAEVMAEAEKYNRGDRDQQAQIALAILHERAACAQHAFAMRWAPPLELQGTKEAGEISKLTTSWSHQVGMGILNR